MEYRKFELRYSAESPAQGVVDTNSSQSKLVAKTIQELRDHIPDGQKGRITMAAAVATDSKGDEHLLIGTSEGEYYRVPKVSGRIEVTVAGKPKHAEVNIVNYARENSLTIVDIGATRAICSECENLINTMDAHISTPLRGRRDRDEDAASGNTF